MYKWRYFSNFFICWRIKICMKKIFTILELWKKQLKKKKNQYRLEKNLIAAPLFLTIFCCLFNNWL